jgi:phenylacetate-CoA ligase
MAEVFPKRRALTSSQVDQLRALLGAILPDNQFYSQKFEAARAMRRFSDLDRFFREVPFTTKQELIDDQRAHPPYGANLTFPLDRYTRCHQTSGTSGTPLRWLDTPESWAWMVSNWETVYRAAGVTRADRVFFAFSFGPFIGFWLAFEAAARMGCLCLPGGGLSTAARLRLILDHAVTVLCCTPTYAIHLAQTAAAEKMDLSASPVKTLLVAGEPGGSIPSSRRRLEELWPGARVFDHHGMTEVGPVSYECPARPGVLHVMEMAYIAEIIDPAAGAAVPDGQTGELVLTPLGRAGSPLLRYRTGDLVRPLPESVCECGRSELALEGGILGRTDDMVVVRGVNIYPAAVEEIVRAAGAVAEYQVQIEAGRALAEMRVQVEPTADCADPRRLAHALENSFEAAFGLRVPVSLAAPGSLPRFEMKANRWAKNSSAPVHDLS